MSKASKEELRNAGDSAPASVVASGLSKPTQKLLCRLDESKAAKDVNDRRENESPVLDDSIGSSPAVDGSAVMAALTNIRKGSKIVNATTWACSISVSSSSSRDGPAHTERNTAAACQSFSAYNAGGLGKYTHARASTHT